MRFRMMVLAAVAASVAVPAVAQTDSPTPAAAPAPKEKKFCRRYAVTGSIIGTRAVCHTKSEWASIDSANAANASDTLGDSRLRNSNPLAK